MKKFLTLALAVALILPMLSSCKDVKPEFKFDLNLTGVVQNAPTAIAGDFTVAVTNAQADVFVIENGAELNDIVVDKEANDWLDNYILANVIEEINDDPATIYDITVKGFVREVVSGVCFTVDKRFTNKPE